MVGRAVSSALSWIKTSSVANELLGVEVRLERALKHTDALRHEGRMFMMDLPQPYGSAIDDQPVGEEYIVRAKILRSPPVRLGALAAEAVHNLRAALDMIAWRLALRSPEPPPESDRDTGFPILSKPDQWGSHRTKRILRWITDPDAIEAIRACQLFNDPDMRRLLFVQAVDNWSKHHALPALLSFRVSRFRMVSDTWEVISVSRGAIADGDEIARVRRVNAATNPDEHYQARMMCHVSFAKDGPGLGVPTSFLEDAYETIRDRVLPSFQPFFAG